MTEQEWPADKVSRRKVAELAPAAKNARTHSPAQISQLVASIQEWGWTIPILVDEDGQIIAGHGRVLAAQQMGLEEIPTMVATGWTVEQKRAYVIADNKLAENAGWDDTILRAELADLKIGGFDLGKIGFSGDELSVVFAEKNSGKTDPDDVPAIQKVVVTRPGDVWLLGATVTCPNCKKVQAPKVRVP